MAFTYDLATDTGKLRLLIADTVEAACDFSDEEIAVALDLNDDSLLRAGAWLLMTLASNRARLAVSVRRGDVSEDLSRIVQALRDQAKELLAQAEAEEGGPLMAVISPAYDRFSARKNAWLDRQGTVTETP